MVDDERRVVTDDLISKQSRSFMWAAIITRPGLCDRVVWPLAKQSTVAAKKPEDANPRFVLTTFPCTAIVVQGTNAIDAPISTG